MPRVILNALDYRERDLQAYIRNEMKLQKVHQKDLADELHMTQQNFSYLISNMNFNPKQLMIVFHRLNTPTEKIGELMKYE